MTAVESSLTTWIRAVSIVDWCKQNFYFKRCFKNVPFKTKQKNRDLRNENIWSLLSLFCIHRWHYSFLEKWEFYRTDCQNFSWSFLSVFSVFCQFSFISKCEIAGIGTVKGVPTAVCSMKNIDYITDFIKILGTCFSYKQQMKEESNLCCTY